MFMANYMYSCYHLKYFKSFNIFTSLEILHTSSSDMKQKYVQALINLVLYNLFAKQHFHYQN